MKPKLQLIINPTQKQLAKQIVETYHSYVPTFKSVGRKIDWLITLEEVVIGMIGIGSSTYPPSKDLLRYLNLTKDSYRQQFNTFANNWRFCMSYTQKNLGSQILRGLRESAPIEWKSKYGDDLKYLITFVGGGHDGAVYKADNWKLIGETSGLPPHKSSSMKWDSSDELKQKFVVPTGENKKLIFLVGLS